MIEACGFRLAERRSLFLRDDVLATAPVHSFIGVHGRTHAASISPGTRCGVIASTRPLLVENRLWEISDQGSALLSMYITPS